MPHSTISNDYEGLIFTFRNRIHMQFIPTLRCRRGELLNISNLVFDSEFQFKAQQLKADDERNLLSVCFIFIYFS